MFSVQLLFLRAPQGAHEKRSAKEAHSYEKKMSLTRPRSAREFRKRNSLFCGNSFSVCGHQWLLVHNKIHNKGKNKGREDIKG